MRVYMWIFVDFFFRCCSFLLLSLVFKLTKLAETERSADVGYIRFLLTKHSTEAVWITNDTMIFWWLSAQPTMK